jgi:trehalose/maltose transport system substrate-binding protein
LFGSVGVTALPVGAPGRRHTGTLGGWQLAVSRYSRHPDLAVDLVLALTSIEQQQRRAIEGALLPTMKALYEAPAILAAQPFLGALPEVLNGAVARPSRIVGVKYNQFSSALWGAVHATLSGEGTARTNLMALERRLDHLSRGGRW